MIVPPLIPYRPHRRVRQKAKRSVPTGPLTLVAASYVDGTSLTLVFDQPIDVSAFDGAAVMVNDRENTGICYIAVGAVTLLNPTTMRVGLNEFEQASGVGVKLSAPSTTNITGVGGGTWAGVTDVELPFG